MWLLVWKRSKLKQELVVQGLVHAALILSDDLIDRDHWLAVRMPGGFLYLRQRDSDSSVTLLGPAQRVFEGELEL